MDRLWRLLIVLAGILAGQIFLYGPALLGQQLLLPLDLLAAPNFYLSPSAVAGQIEPLDLSQMDQVIQYEPSRWFMANELRAGRWPVWTPYSYAGAPFLGAQWSPFQIWYVLWPDPRCLAWIQLLVAIVAGTGAYCSCRSVLQTSIWPATVAAWCYPLTGFFVIWQGHALPHSAAFFPWMLWATDLALKQPRRLGGPLLGLFTYCSIGCGAIDIAGQSLMICGLYAVFRVVQAHRVQGFNAARLILGPVAGWGIGFLLAAAMLLPLFDYTSTSARIRDRIAGKEERPPQGIRALPYVFTPEIQGITRSGSVFISPGNAAESTATGYAGFLTTCLLAPLSLCRRVDRWQIYFWAVCAVIGMSWSLNLPGFVSLFRLPLLNSLSYNRFVFVTGWSIIGLAAIGLDVLWKQELQRTRWFLPAAFTTGAIGAYCLYRSAYLPEPLASLLEQYLRAGITLPLLKDLADLVRVKQYFTNAYLAAAITSGFACLCWVTFACIRVHGAVVSVACSFALMIELFRFASPYPLMSDPKWYYPPVAALEQLAAAPSGRVLGVGCLPPKLLERYQLSDIRGYDAVDPQRIVDLLSLVQDQSVKSPSYARTQDFIPMLLSKPNEAPRLPGVLNMLNLRYLIFRGEPANNWKPLISVDDYCVWENPDALPRVYVPRQIATIKDSENLRIKLAQPDFNASVVSFTDSDRTYAKCAGTASLVREHAREVVLSANMQTKGVVVLADAWYSGWQATVNNRPVPILKVNHAIRGVEVSSGQSTIVMRYLPASLTYGIWISLTGLLVLSGWSACTFISMNQPSPQANNALL